MPTVTEQTARGYAHCSDSLCGGNAQQPADVIVVTTAYTYVDSGGDLPGFEKSFQHVVFATPADAICPGCGGPREAAVQKRPEYPTSQWAQDGLLKLIRDGMVKPMGELASASASELEELREQLAEMRALLEKQSAKRGPGRPRKDETEPEMESDA